MTMLAIHSSAISSRIASYHEFLSRYSKHSKVVYGFIEGKEDPAFYRGFIELQLQDNWVVELWPAGNKEQVYRIHADLDWRRFPKARVCFFVDRDLSDLLPEKLVKDSNIYVTDGYSIENDIVSKAVCQRVLSELCGFANANHTELENVGRIFEQEYEVFLNAMIPIMAWILVWRRVGNGAHLDNIEMSHLFSFHNGRLKVNPTPKGKGNVADYLHDRCKVALDPHVDINRLIADFRQKDNHRKFTRGKYVLWFLVEFCNAVHRDATILFSGLAKPPKLHVTLSCSNGMAVIGVRARIPMSLRKFLKSTFCAYIEKVEAKLSKSK